jgi:hypothetical protein
MFTLLASSEASCLDILLYGITRGAAGIAILVAAPVVTLLVVTVPVQLHRISFAPKDIPWVGQGDYTWFPKLRSSLIALKNERRSLEEGWEKVCLHTLLASLIYVELKQRHIVQQQRKAVRQTIAALAFSRPASL